jgi:hypothetical protein
MAGSAILILLLLSAQAGGRKGKRKDKKQRQSKQPPPQVKRLNKRMKGVARKQGGTYRTAAEIRRTKAALLRLFSGNSYAELTSGLRRASVGTTHRCILTRPIDSREGRALSELLSLETGRKLELTIDGTATIRIIVHQL